MNDEVRITVLVEETARRSDLVAVHGWSVWIETGSRRLVFDVGQGAEVVSNARVLGVDLGTCDTVVLSHGHYDHTGGLEAVLDLAPGAKVYAHPLATAEKYRLNDDGTSRYNGMPSSCREALRRSSTVVVETPGPTDLGGGLWVTGAVPRANEFEDAGGAYFLEPGATRPDPIGDDQALFFESVRGLIVVLGCAHAGAINTIRYVCELTGTHRVHAVIGGLHLIHASQRRVLSTIEALRDIDPDLIGAAHCTGVSPGETIRAALGEKWVECRGGTRMRFDAARLPGDQR